MLPGSCSAPQLEIVLLPGRAPHYCPAVTAPLNSFLIPHTFHLPPLPQNADLYDSDGFLRESLDEERPPQFAAASAPAMPQLSSSSAAVTPGGSVKRNLGSALDQVDAESPAGQEAHSQPGSAGRTASGRGWQAAGGSAAAALAAASPHATSGSNRSLGARQQDEGQQVRVGQDCFAALHFGCRGSTDGLHVVAASRVQFCWVPGWASTLIPEQR